MQIGLYCLAENLLELFAVFKERRPILRLGVQQKALVASVANQRSAFVTVGDEFECLLAAEALIARLQVDFEVLFGAGFAVAVVVALVYSHVDAAYFVDRVFEAV